MSQVQVSNDDGTSSFRDVFAEEIHGEWFIHKSGNNNQYFSVSHLPTGLLFSAEYTLGEAQKIAKALTKVPMAPKQKDEAWDDFFKGRLNEWVNNELKPVTQGSSHAQDT